LRVGTAVLVVELMEVLPQVDGEKRHVSMGKRRIAVVGRRDLEHSILAGDPSYLTTTELAGSRVAESLGECRDSNEVFLDGVLQLARRLAAALCAHAVPKEGVVPGLGRVVEHYRR